MPNCSRPSTRSRFCRGRPPCGWGCWWTSPSRSAPGTDTTATTTPTATELAEQEVATLEQKALDDKAKDVDDQREAMLITVQGMNKAALSEYAKKFDHSSDSKAKVDDMRITVNGLIHQFGVR